MENSQHYPSSLKFPATGSSQQKTDVAQYMNNNYLFDQKFRNQVSGVTDFKVNTPIGSSAYGAPSSFEHYSTRAEEPEEEEEEEEENKEEEEVEEGVVDPVFASATPLGSAQWENFPEVLSGMQFAPMSGGAFGGGGGFGGRFGGGFGGGFGGMMNALGGPIGGAPVMGNPRVPGTFNPFQTQFNKKDLPEFLQSMMDDTPEYLR
uniref:Uncharacterized protein n=1 Tax=viral metagenome TaxID=1070528 RepID=A0A6C0K4Y4_9ZZZZ